MGRSSKLRVEGGLGIGMGRVPAEVIENVSSASAAASTAEAGGEGGGVRDGGLAVGDVDVRPRKEEVE